MPEHAQTYDVAVSFSGAQRALVEPVVRACQGLGLVVFYDADHTADFWGRNFIVGMRRVYGGARAQYFIPFISTEYLAGGYPMDEFNTAVEYAVSAQHEDYILPVLVGDVRVPAEWLSPATGYLRLEDFAPDELARRVADRVRAARGREPREITETVAPVPPVRLPRIPTADFGPGEFLAETLARVGSRFTQESESLAAYGVRCQVAVSPVEVRVRASRNGDPFCGLRLYFGDGFLPGRLLVSFAWPRVADNDSFNGWVTAEWDRNADRAGLVLTDISAGTTSIVMEDGDHLFRHLWDKIVDLLESSVI